jgi:hypothetical protein
MAVHHARGGHGCLNEVWVWPVDNVDEANGLIFAVKGPAGSILISMLKPMRSEAVGLSSPFIKKLFEAVS